MPINPEQHRLATLYKYEILNTPREDEFDDLTRLAARICAAHSAAISFIDTDRQWFKTCVGISLDETPRATAFCDHTIRGTEPFIVCNAQADARFANNPLVVEPPYLRAYLGVPLIVSNGAALGALTVLDFEPRSWTAEQIDSLQILARQVINQLELRLLHREQIALLQAQDGVETELRISEERYRNLVENSHDLIWAVDIEGRITFINQAAQTVCGYAPEEMIGRSFLDFMPETEHEKELAARERAGATGRDTVDYLIQVYRKDGSTAYLNAGATVQRDSTGKMIGTSGIARDVTAQTMAEHKLRDSQALISIAGQAARLGGWRIELDESPRLIWSDEACAIHDLPPGTVLSLEEAVGLLTSPWRDVVYRTVEACVIHGTPFELEPEVVTATGRHLWIRLIGRPAVDDAGNITHVHGAVQDITEQKEAADALRASEELFRLLAENIDDVFWIWDPNVDRIVYASPRYEEVFHDSREALFDNPRTYQRMIPPEDLARLEAAMAQDPYKIEVEHRLNLPDGTTRWVSVRTFPVYDDAGHIRYSVGTGRDITGFVNAANKLRQSEQEYRLLFTSNPHPMWVYDQETLRIQDVNDAAVRHYGYTRAEFLTMTIRDIRPPEDIAPLEHTVTSLGHGPNFGVWRHVKKDGTIIDVEVSSDVIDFGGRPARLVLALDITKRRQAERRLRQQAALLNIAHDAIIVRDLDNRITFWNAGAERLYGWKAEEAVGRSIVSLLHPDAATFDAANAELLAEGAWSGEIIKQDRAGNELIVDASWTLVYDETGEPISILAINTDVTERNQLQAQILRAQRMESIGTLAGGIAHDLNNVLSPLLLAVGMLRQRMPGERDRRLLDMLEENAQRGAEMVRQVLTFARGADGDRIQVDAAQSIRELERLVRDTFDRRIQVVTSVAPKLWLIISDPTQIHQVLLNLCVNARDAMPDGGTLELHAANVTIDAQYAGMNPDAQPGNYVQLTVSDTGSGIPAEIRDRIFDPFFTTKEVGRGTGLGLSTSQALIKRHDGFITVYSEEGRGTIFHVYLPAAQAQDELVVPQGVATTAAHGQGELILVVDDEKTVRTVIQQTLESFGYRVVAAEDGATGLSLYVQHADEVAVVLTDMMMPIMDGYALIQALYKVNPDIKIIAASGLSTDNAEAKISAEHVQHFLQKPYTAEAMLAKIAEVLAED